MGVGYKSGAGFRRSTVCGFLHNPKDGFRIRDITKQKPYGVNVDRRSRSMRDITAFMLIGDKSVRDLTVLLLIGDKSVRDSAALMLTHDKSCLEIFFSTSRMLIIGGSEVTGKRTLGTSKMGPRCASRFLFPRSEYTGLQKASNTASHTCCRVSAPRAL